MSKIGYIITFLVMLMVGGAPAHAWQSNNHQEIVEELYYSLPYKVSQNLDLQVMKEGSVVPDFVFKDFVFHVYPLSYIKARFYLERGRSYYHQGDYYHASYCLGVATHYITDSTSAFHRLHAYNQEDHDEYEYQALSLPIQLEYLNHGLLWEISLEFIRGEFSWRVWKETRNPHIVQQDLNMASSMAYSEIKRILDVYST